MVEDIVKKNAMLLTELDDSAKKVIPKRPPLTPDLVWNLDDTRDPIRPSITMDFAHMESVVETTVDECTDPQFICAIGSKVKLTTTPGKNLKLDVKCYWCNFCNFKTGEMNMLLKHLIEHRFQCKFCKYESFSRASVIQHCNKTHNEFKGFSASLKFCSYLPHIVSKKISGVTDKDVKRKREEEFDEEIRRKRIRDKELDKDGEESRYDETELLSMEVDEVGDSGDESSALNDKIIIPRSVTKNLPAPETAPTLNETGQAVPSTSLLTEEMECRATHLQNKNSSLPVISCIVSGEEAVAEAENRPKETQPSRTTTEAVAMTSGLCWSCGYCEFITLSQALLKIHLNDRHVGKPHKYVALLAKSSEEMNKIRQADSKLPNFQKESHSNRKSECRSSFPTVASILNTPNTDSSRDNFTRPKLSNMTDNISTNSSPDNATAPEVSNIIDTSSTNSSRGSTITPKLSNIGDSPSTNCPRDCAVVPNMSNIGGSPSTNNSRDVALVAKVSHTKNSPSMTSSQYIAIAPKVSNIADTSNTKSLRDVAVVPGVQNIVDVPGTKSSRDDAIVTRSKQRFPAVEIEDENDVEKEIPSLYKCANCNYSSADIERVKAHLALRHIGSVMYILDMKAIKFHKKRFLFFCLKNKCNFETKERLDYLEHVEECIPTSSYKDIDPCTLKSLNLTKQFIGKPFRLSNEITLKSGKIAEYGCLYCNYFSENNTRVKKHVLNIHKSMPTKIKCLNNSKDYTPHTITFCCHCLWETGEEKKLGIHLAEKHDDQSFLCQENTRKDSGETDISPSTASDKQDLGNSVLSQNLINIQSNQSFSHSGQSGIVLEEKISDYVEEEGYVKIIGKIKYNKAVAAFISSVDTNDIKGKARPTRNAAMKAQIKSKLRKLPILFKCYHCQDHLAFGIKLMKNHIEKEHNNLPMITYNLLKLEQNHMQALVYICPHAECLFTAAFATDVINHARKNHGLQPTTPDLVLLSSIIPTTSLNSSTRSRKATAATGETYECLYCSISPVVYHSRRDMKKHFIDKHPQEDFLYRDCIARKLRQQSRYYMCHELTCDFTCANYKDYSLHLLAHKKSAVYECSKCTWFSVDEAGVKTHIADEHDGEDVRTIKVDLEISSGGQVVKLVGGTVIKSEIV